MFEIVDRDAGARLGKWIIGKNKITTPAIAIVINPNKMVVEPKELKKFGAEILITNSYIINKNENMRTAAMEKGVHNLIGWDGPVYTDSGTYQMFSQGIKNINPQEIIEFQKKIQSDIVTPLDVFTTPFDNRRIAEKNLAETIRRTKFARAEVSGILVGPIQGGRFLDLRVKASKQMAKINPDLFAIGGIVPLMNSYNFRELCDIILTCKNALPSNKPVHAFGCGHPITFALLTACGCDLFDSALYALAAERSGYLTSNGTHQLRNLQEFPCSCEECFKHTPEQVKNFDKPEQERFLALHNLHVTFAELRTIRQAIRENSLWELVQQRARAHPKLLEALIFALKKYKDYFLENDIVSKKSAFFWSGIESDLRPEVLRTRLWLKRVRSKKFFTKQPFGKIPIELQSVYPFFQSIIPDYKEKQISIKPANAVLALLDYQFGRGASKNFKDIGIEISKKTGKIRRIWNKDRSILLGTVRPYDGFFIPTIAGAQLLKKHMKKVIVNDSEVADYILKGSDALAKFCLAKDDILPGEEVAVLHKGKILAVGCALLNKKEISEFKRGAAVKVRAKA